jgi:hypothetical protein
VLVVVKIDFLVQILLYVYAGVTQRWMHAHVVNHIIDARIAQTGKKRLAESKRLRSILYRARLSMGRGVASWEEED